MGKPVPRIGVDKLYYAPILSDSDAGTIYGTPVWLQGVNQITYNPNVQNASYDADDGTYVSFSADGEIQTTITVADLKMADYAALLGLQTDANGMVIEGESDNAPEIAIGFRSQKSDGTYRYIWVLKGKFAKAQEDYQTKGGSGITYQPRQIVHTAVKRTSDGQRRHILDTSDVSLTDAQLGDATYGWFSSPNFTVAGYSGSSTPISSLVASTGSNAGEIGIAFTAATGASAVSVQVSDGNGWTTVANLAADASSATIGGLVAGAEYFVRVVVVGGSNAGISNVDSAAAHS